MADMVWRPVFRDVDPERAVVLEEIAMYEDEPQESVFDALGEAVFGEHPLGRAIIGRAPVIAGTPVADIAAFHARRYVPGSVVVAAAGSVDHDAIVEPGAEHAGRPACGQAAPRRWPRPRARPATLRFQTKGHRAGPQSASAPPGCRAATSAGSASRVLDAIFGGLSSSRLFQAVREERGQAYAVYSFAGQYATRARSASTSARGPTTWPRRWTWSARSSTGCGRSPHGEELARTKENVKARVILGLESSSARMNRLGGSILFDLPVLEPDELMARFDAVTLDDLRGLVAELWPAERLSAAGIGPDEAASAPRPRRRPAALGCRAGRGAGGPARWAGESARRSRRADDSSSRGRRPAGERARESRRERRGRRLHPPTRRSQRARCLRGGVTS
jgi:predicted Zn-dependent peptidase